MSGRTAIRPSFAVGVALVLAVGAAPSSAVAQQTGDPDTPEALRARLDSLRPLLAEAGRDLDGRSARMEAARRAAAEAEARIDTFRVGGDGIQVLTPVDQADATRALFDEVWDETFGDLGHSPSLARSTVLFQRTYGDPVPIHAEGQAHSISLDAWTSRERARSEIRRILSNVMVHDLQPGRNPVGLWLRADPLTPPPPESVYRRIAVTRSKTTRACLGGDAAACGTAMALGVTRDASGLEDQIDEWYTPEEQRALIAERFNFFSRQAAAIRHRCVDRGDQAACDDIFANDRRDWAPLGRDVRQSLVTYALEVGPPGSWERLVEDPGMTAIEALEHASGQSIDALLAGWRERLVASRPGSFQPLIPSSGRALAWTLLFAAFALRSTRWRLG